MLDKEQKEALKQFEAEQKAQKLYLLSKG